MSFLVSRSAELKMLSEQGMSLAALKLFREAADREEATAKLAHRVLEFLFRARWDEGLRFVDRI